MRKIFMRVMMFFCVLVFSGCHLVSRENRACYKDQCYKIELAITMEQKAKGLQNRDSLEKDRGMLFLMDNSITQKFWMKETLIPLDMIWMDDLGKILYIEQAAVSCEKDPCPTYGPDFPAGYVLELNAGEAARLDMHRGDRIVLDLKNVK